MPSEHLTMTGAELSALSEEELRAQLAEYEARDPWWLDWRDDHPGRAIKGELMKRARAARENAAYRTRP